MEEIKAPLDGCPYCNSNKGYYVKVYISGSSIWKHNFDGSEADNESFHDHLNYKEGKIAYCIDCNKRLFKMSDL